MLGNHPVDRHTKIVQYNLIREKREALQHTIMAKLINEIKYDINFLKSHSLQPKWYKILKIFILLALLMVSYFYFGFSKSVLVFAIFIFLSTLVHLVYRIKTKKWTQSWLDFIVLAENDPIKTKRIGKYYYSAVLINGILSVIIGVLLA